MDQKKKRPKKTVVPVFTTLPVSFQKDRTAETNIGIQSEDDVVRMKEWVDFNEK